MDLLKDLAKASGNELAGIVSDGIVAGDVDGDIDTGSPRGGDSSEVADLIDSDVVDVFSSRYAFAALKNDGSVVAWGDPLRGGDTGDAQRLLRKGVQSVASTGTSFAALKKNGRVVTWGDPWRGGSKDVVDFHTNTAKPYELGYGWYIRRLKECVDLAYENNETDEFISPTIIDDYKGIQNDDSIMMVNFRADRVIEILKPFLDPNFNDFDIKDDKIIRNITRKL